MKLPEYASFEDKMQYYETNQDLIGGSCFINTEQEFDAMLNYIKSSQQEIEKRRQCVKEKFRNLELYKDDTEEAHQQRFISMGLENDLFFRGVSEARYKIFASAQRKWLEKDFEANGITYINFVEGLLSQIRQNVLLNDYYSALRVPENDLLYMSLLQHYGECSPLVDISYDIKSALFFALNYVDATDIEHKDEINKYCSLYVFNTFNNQYWADLSVILQEGQDSAAKLLETSKHPIETIDTSNVDSADKYTRWMNNSNNGRGLHDWKLALVKLPTAKGGIIPTTRIGEYICWTNLNLLAQKGAFLLYANDKTPLEEYIYYHKYLPNIICYNINKCLKDYILGKIKLTEKNIYPKFKDIVEVEINTLLNSLKK